MTRLQGVAGALQLSLLLSLTCPAPAADNPSAELQLTVDDARGQALPCRIHLFDPAGKPVQAAGQPLEKALPDETRRREVLVPHERARKFWQELGRNANAD